MFCTASRQVCPSAVPLANTPPGPAVPLAGTVKGSTGCCVAGGGVSIVAAAMIPARPRQPVTAPRAAAGCPFPAG